MTRDRRPPPGIAPCSSRVVLTVASRRRRCRGRPPRTGRIRRSAAVSSPRTRRSSSPGAPARSRRPRSGPRSTPRRPTRPRRRASKAATFAYDGGRPEPDRLRGRRDLRRQRPRLLHAERARRLHDVAPRAGPRLRLGHAQVVPGVHDRARTAATTRRPSRSTSSATSRVSTTTSTTPTTATTRTRSCRPSRGPSRRPAGTRTPSGRATRPTLQRRYDLASLVDEVLDLPEPHDDADARRLAGLGRLRRLHDADRRPADRRERRATASSPATRSCGRTVSLQRRVTGTTAWVAAGDHVGRPELGHLRRDGTPRDRLRVPRGLRRPRQRGPQGRHVRDVPCRRRRLRGLDVPAGAARGRSHRPVRRVTRRDPHDPARQRCSPPARAGDRRPHARS